MNDKAVRVRIAPSPTGYLHVGTARAALFNFLFARHTGGKFLVRIEDTDRERSQAEFLEPIIDGLKWLGMVSDEELVYQSQRSDLYADYLERFLKTDRAYYCFCTKEELQAAREKARQDKGDTKYNRKCCSLTADEVAARRKAGEAAVVRVRIPDGETAYDDLVSGRLTRHSNDIEDFIVARSDGSVTYNFAVVIDDHTMGITHVIRGNDHITNTFKQVVLYDAFGMPLPQFGHLPLILRPDKKKVSKRLGDKGVGEYQNEGILAEAMVNYLSLLGWSPKTDQEIYRTSELIERFDIANLNAANAVFDEDKLLAFNRAHLQAMSDHDVAVMVAPLLVEAGLTTKYWLETRWEYLRQVVAMLQPRVERLGDFVTLGAYFFEFDGTYEEAAEAKHFNSEAADLLEALVGRFEAATPFSHETVEAALGKLAEERELKKAKLIHPTRLAVSGMSRGPGLYDLLLTLGQEVVVARMKTAIEHIRRKQP